MTNERANGWRVAGWLVVASVASLVASSAAPQAPPAGGASTAAPGVAPPAQAPGEAAKPSEGPLDEAQRAYAARRWADAARAARGAFEAEEAAGRPESPLALQALDLLVGSLWRSRKVDPVETVALAERAVAVRERLTGPDDPALALCLINLGMVLDAMAAYDRALPPLERALAIRERAFGPEHAQVAKCYQYLGRVHSGMGDYAAARTCHERALAIREHLLGADDPEIAASLVDLGNVLKTQGDYTGARPLLERALTILEKAFGSEDATVGTAAYDLGVMLHGLGDYTGAEGLFRRSLAIYLKSLGPDHDSVGRSLSSLGYVLRAQGRLDEAEDAFVRGLAVRERALRPGDPDVIWTLKGLAGVLADRGDLAGARARLERALSLAEENLGPDHPMVAYCAAALGDACRLQGDVARARELYERALGIRERALGDRHPRTAESRIDLARLMRAGGDNDGALDSSLRAQATLREHLYRTTGALAEREALQYRSVLGSGLDIALSTIASGAGDDAVRRTWDEVVRSRALVLDAIASRHRLVSESDDAGVGAAAAELERKRALLSRLVLNGPDSKQPQAYALKLREARDAEEAAERRLAEASGLFRLEEDRRSRGLAEVLGSLPAGGALVSYVQYRPVAARPADPGRGAPAPAPGGPAGEFGAATYVALVTRAGAEQIRIVQIGTVAEIDRLVQRWREMITSPPADAQALAARRAAGDALRAAVWDPIAGYLGHAKQVFVVPEGALNLVGIAALPSGRDRYLLETGPTVHYLSAERDLVPEATPAVSEGGLLVVGGPDFDAPPEMPPSSVAAGGEAPEGSPPASEGSRAATRETYRGRPSSCEGFNALRFEPLPSAGAEATEVASLWRRAPRATGEPAVLELTSGRATEATFKANASGRTVLHLATHAFFLEGRCGTANEGSTEIGRGASAGESPLLLAGLALAGANLRGAETVGAEQEDGVLTAEEIASLDLRGVEWAVLSACGTGLGRVEAGEGVLGLRRAFQVAGARTVIMSLWAVEDHTTREWIRRLYETRLGGRTTAEAVRQASLRILNDRRRAGVTTDPFYWGAFVAAGDWR